MKKIKKTLANISQSTTALVSKYSNPIVLGFIGMATGIILLPATPVIGLVAGLCYFYYSTSKKDFN